MANQTASERAGIDGRNQKLATYLRVLNVRAEAFATWMREKHNLHSTCMDESDWDDEYQAWLERDSIA